MRYTLDTNILINMNRQYPRDIFPSIWRQLENAIDRSELCICEAVLRELERGGDDLHSWAKNLPGFVCPIQSEELITVTEISTSHPNWVRQQMNEADPFVIAHAKYEGSAIVSEEKAVGR
ncbi:MAG: hypothetical protein CSA83_02390, partial [Actinomycetales bacterium]